MVIANKMLDNCFSIRFQNVRDIREPRTADLVVNQKGRKEFFELVRRFGLIAIYTENDVWHVKPNPNTNPQDLMQHISTWDIMFHKYMAANNDFKRENETRVIPLPIEVILDVTGSMA